MGRRLLDRLSVILEKHQKEIKVPSCSAVVTIFSSFKTSLSIESARFSRLTVELEPNTISSGDTALKSSAAATIPAEMRRVLSAETE
jgi:hypothetical protein